MTLRSLIHIWAWFRWQDPWLGTDFIMGCGSLGRGECILQFGEMWIAVAEHKARRPLKLSITLLPPLYMHATLLNKRLRLFPLFLKLKSISSVAQSCLTLCDPMNRSTPGLPVHHQLLEFTQIHVHRVSDAIQPSHPLSTPSPPAPNPSQHQSLFQWVNSLHEVAKVLEFQL